MSILLTTPIETYCSLWVLQRKEQSVSNREAILSCSEVPRRYLDATPERSWCGRRGCRGSEAGNNLWGRLHHLQSQWLFQTADWPWSNTYHHHHHHPNADLHLLVSTLCTVPPTWCCKSERLKPLKGCLQLTSEQQRHSAMLTISSPLSSLGKWSNNY